MSTIGHIFHTMTTDYMGVSVATEVGVAGTTVLVVRTCVGVPVMGLPVAHVSRAILSEMFDSTDVDAILSRLAE